MREKITQQELAIDYVRLYGSITPSKLSGVVYKGTIFGHSIDRRCRELRAKGIFNSTGKGKFEVFSLREIKIDDSGIVDGYQQVLV